MHLEGGLRYFLLLVTVALGVVFQGCYSRPTNVDLKPVSPLPAGTGGPYKADTIFVATNREQEKESSGPYFNKERSKRVHYAKFGISVPNGKDHGANVFKTPGGGRVKPEKQFFATSSVLLDEAMFREQLKNQVQGNAKSKKVWIYVHGVYTRFAEGVFFISQLNRDSGLEGIPLLFTWPTGGEWFDYIYDKDSAATSRDALEETIRIASESGAEEIFILAHSMGCQLTMEALRQVAIAGDVTFGGKLKCVLLASPDISVEVFESQLERIGSQPLRPRIGILTSHDDKLLKIAAFIARGGERMGRLKNDEIKELGVDVFDLTGFSLRGVSTHYKFAALPRSLEDIHNKMDENLLSDAEALVYPIDEYGKIIVPPETPGFLVDIKDLLRIPASLFDLLEIEGEPGEEPQGPQEPTPVPAPAPVP